MLFRHLVAGFPSNLCIFTKLHLCCTIKYLHQIFVLSTISRFNICNHQKQEEDYLSWGQEEREQCIIFFAAVYCSEGVDSLLEWRSGQSIKEKGGHTQISMLIGLFTRDSVFLTQLAGPFWALASWSTSSTETGVDDGIICPPCHVCDWEDSSTMLRRDTV